jgi:hypothetical protein
VVAIPLQLDGDAVAHLADQVLAQLAQRFAYLGGVRHG